MKLDDIIDFWNRWGIPLMVLLSFILQILLLVFGEKRRRSSSAVLRGILWLAYLLADSTAIYALGHLSVISGSRDDHQLVAFWAPFLLTHLGGPDNITAYALEDNNLWLRHMQTFFVQALGAAYAIFKYKSSSEILLLLGAISMLAAGLVKYGERIWALKCGNMSSIRDNFNKSDHRANPSRFVTADNNSKTDDEILLEAHYNFSVCKSVFLDTTLEVEDVEPERPLINVRSVGVETYKMVEMELSLMYDILYTKASVIHTWYGFCIHFISLIGTVITLCLFKLSISSRGNGYSLADVIISYVLSVGALILEILLVCRAILSSWTYYSLVHSKTQPPLPPPPSQPHHPPSQPLLSRHVPAHAEPEPKPTLFRIWAGLRWPAQPTRRSKWRGSMGQYNLFHLCTRDTTKIGSILARKTGMADWWNKMHFSGTFSGTDTLSMDRLKGLVSERLLQADRLAGARIGVGSYTSAQYLNSRGSITLKERRVDRPCSKWSLDIDFDESILVWHIATDIFLSHHKTRRLAALENEPMLTEATRVLSNYMLFLLVEKPEMLPGRTRHNLYSDICKPERLAAATSSTNQEGTPQETAQPESCNWYYMKKLFRDPPNSSRSRITKRETLAKNLYEPVKGYRSHHPEEAKNSRQRPFRESGLMCGVWLGKELLDLGSYDTLELILGVWVEMMVYAADHCNRDSHARQLSNGGEFLTIVWLLMHHRIYIERYNTSILTARRNHAAVPGQNV